jgi:Regulator of chromosome condensation (RCC1) repeat/BTB/POZ domain
VSNSILNKININPVQVPVKQLPSIWSALKCAEFDLTSVERIFIHQVTQTALEVHPIYVLTNDDHLYCGRWNATEGHYDLKIWDELCGKGIADISCGSFHSLALNKEGRVFSWGWNGCGQLGIGKLYYEKKPVPHEVLFGIPSIIQMIACGSDSSYALTKDSILYAWGSGAHGKLGDGKSRDYLFPVKIGLPKEASTPIKAIYAVGENAFFVDSMGGLFGCGWNDEGQLAPNSYGKQFTSFTLVKIPHQPFFNAKAFAYNGSIFAFVASDDYLWIREGFQNNNAFLPKPPRKLSHRALVNPSLVPCANGIAVIEQQAPRFKKKAFGKVYLVTNRASDLASDLHATLLKSDLTTIIANKPLGLKLEFSRNMEETSEISENLEPKPPCKLLFKSKNVKSVLDQRHFADVYFVFPLEKRIPSQYENIACHRAVLSLASKEFYKRFQNEWANMECIPVEAYSFKVFDQFIRFLYLRETRVDQATSMKDLIGLYSIAQEFSSKSLKRLCVQEFQRRLQSSSLEDLLLALDTLHDAQNLKELIMANVISSRINENTFLVVAKMAHKSGNESLFMETAR